jgi:rhodanese-related sulfurtransferase
MKRLRDKLQQAGRTIESIGFDEAVALLEVGQVVFLDVRDKDEVKEHGTIPSAVHVSRGFLEFAIDPQSPGYNAQFSRDVSYIVFCASGMRSLLAAETMLEMGIDKVKNLDGGFAGWRHRGGPIDGAS